MCVCVGVDEAVLVVMAQLHSLSFRYYSFRYYSKPRARARLRVRWLHGFAHLRQCSLLARSRFVARSCSGRCWLVRGSLLGRPEQRLLRACWFHGVRRSSRGLLMLLLGAIVIANTEVLAIND